MTSIDGHTPTPGAAAEPSSARATPPYVMRPATEADRTTVADLISLRTRGWGYRTGFDPADLEAAGTRVRELLGGDEEGRPIVWLLTEDCAVIGCVALLRATPDWGWTAAQQTEPSLTVVGMFTAPRVRRERTSRLMAWWTLGYAARLGGVQWVRGATRSGKLMRFIRDEMHCDVNTVTHSERPIHLLQRSAECTPGLSAFITDAASPKAYHAPRGIGGAR